MKLYRFVWLYVIVYSCVWIFQNANHGLKMVERFFKNENATHNLNSHHQPIRNKNSYLVVIGTDVNKYSFFYQPNSVVMSFGGYKRDIFEQPLLSLDFQRVYTIVSSESTMSKIQKAISDRNQQDRWYVLMTSRSKKYGTYRTDVRMVRKQIYSFNSTIPLPSTILFDIGDFSTEYLRDTMEVFSDSCVQYLIYHRKRSISNIKRITQMMERFNFRQVKNVKSQNIATFVSKSSPLWKKQ